MIRETIFWLGGAVDFTGVVVMLLGFVFSVGSFVLALWNTSGTEIIAEIQTIRCKLGTYLVFALELMIVSDLLQSAISHELEDLYFLGALVALRTTIAFFLNKEIQELREAGT